MSNTERLYAIERLIRARGCVSFATLMEELEVSRATIKRDLEYLRSRMGAPIEFDRFQGGYVLKPQGRGGRQELPGLWFSERELFALLSTHQLLNELDRDGTLSRHLAPLKERIHAMMGASPEEATRLTKRVRILTPSRRPVSPKFFELIGECLVQRRRLWVRYQTRGRGGEMSEREISPQRLVHHRNTWYTDAWCHKQNELRRFALDAIQDARALEDKAKEISLRQVQEEMDAGYGIYAGAQPQQATLVFTAEAAQWVSREEWHPSQTSRWLADGRYELKLPYARDTEIVMDILRHGDQVEVVGPAALRKTVLERLRQAVARYSERTP